MGKIKYAFKRRLSERDYKIAVDYLPYLLAELFPLPFGIPLYTNPKIKPFLFAGLMPMKEGIQVDLSREQTVIVGWRDLCAMLQRHKNLRLSPTQAAEFCVQMGARVKAGEEIRAASLEKTRAKTETPYVREDGSAFTPSKGLPDS